jgi:hypothetical protein
LKNRENCPPSGPSHKRSSPPKAFIDEINAYNDGPATPGAKPMGPFYKLESSSPAKELEPGQSVTHVQTTFHFQGDKKELNELTRKILGVSITEINSAFE